MTATSTRKVFPLIRLSQPQGARSYPCARQFSEVIVFHGMGAGKCDSNCCDAVS